MNIRKKIVIVQPYVPSYRVAFFEKLIARLSMNGIECIIAAATPDAAQSKRGDNANPDWLMPVSQKKISMFGRTLVIGGARHAWKGADAVIVGLVGSSVDTYRALFDGMTSSLRVGVWGHIKSYVNMGHPLDLALEKWQMNRADHIFAYTPGGADYAEAAGVHRQKVTTVMNSVDTTSLSTAVSQTTDKAAAGFAIKHGIDPRRTFAFFGGLDSSKRVDFLAHSLEALWSKDPSIKVVVGGLGSEANLLDPAAARGQVIMLGYVDAAQQALIARNAVALLMPGRIGLVAVDSLVLGLPIITTDWPFHAPEVEYLTEGESRITSANDVSAFVETIQTFMEGHGETYAQRTQSTFPTLESMVDNYVEGVFRLLDIKESSV